MPDPPPTVRKEKDESTHKRILRLAIPNVLSNLSVPLLGVADTVLMGRMTDAKYLGAIALGGILFNFIYWGFGFLRMTTTGLTAQYFGAEDRDGAERVLGQSVVLAFIGAGLVLLLQEVIAYVGFGIIGGDEETKQLARSYYDIRIWAAPATLGLFAIQGWLLGMQNARYPLLLTVLVNLTNIALNVWFIYGPMGLKSDGVALGTVCAQYLGLAVGAILILRRYRSFLGALIQGLRSQGLKHYFGVSADLLVRTMCLLFVFAFFTSESASMNAQTLAANTILLQLFYIMSYGVDGFAYAAESLTGRFLGARDRASLIDHLKGIFQWGMGIGLLAAITYVIAGPLILDAFTDLEMVLKVAKTYLPWVAAVSFAGAAAFLWDGVYIGATASKAMRNSMLLATVLVFIPTYFLASKFIGNHGLWLAMLLFMLARSVALTVLARREIINKVQEEPIAAPD